MFRANHSGCGGDTRLEGSVDTGRGPFKEGGVKYRPGFWLMQLDDRCLFTQETLGRRRWG